MEDVKSLNDRSMIVGAMIVLEIEFIKAIIKSFLLENYTIVLGLLLAFGVLAGAIVKIIEINKLTMKYLNKSLEVKK